MSTQENVKELLRLIKENPDLPIIPMVYSEVVEEDNCGYWPGKWDSVEVDECFCSEKTNGYFIKSLDDVFGVLEETMSTEEFNALPESEEECRPYYDKLPWEKAIIIYIGCLG